MTTKLKFSMVIGGEDIVEHKFHVALQNNPDLQMELIHGIGQIIMLSLGLKKSDCVYVESFKVGKYEEDKSSEKPSVDDPTKKVEEQNEESNKI